ncbi:MAG: transcriptional regulator [Candidatus Omnitrophica bacterium]|nr:transcriptional regulator [Candidatus Omnitrophota bacterium]
MAITRDFKETVQKRALQDAEFREGMLRESIECMLAGDLKTGKVLLRDYINAMIGFEKLAKLTKKDAKSLMRMLSSNGNPTASNLFDVIYVLEKEEKIKYLLHPAP